jgi:hypothetical protein
VIRLLWYYRWVMGKAYGHQDDGVDAQSPFLADHHSYFAPEDACGDGLVAFSLSEEADADGEAGCNPLLGASELAFQSL